MRASTSGQPALATAQHEVAPKASTANEIWSGIRRSCDECGRRKKRCDGERPSCRRCVAAGHACAYSKRKWHLPRPGQDQRRDGDGIHLRQLPTTSKDEAPLAFKRCRFSASPATGLVGMQENAFLSDFFGCVGFIPLTSQSNIRESMVNLMLRPAALQPTGLVYRRTNVGEFGGNSPGKGCGATVEPADPSACTFWCAVAMGAILKGSPVESMSRYLELAGDGFRCWSGPVDAEVAKAWVMLGYLYLFSGNNDLFQEYMERAESFVDACIQEGSTEMIPVGFAEMVQHRMTVKVCTGDVDSGEMESFVAQEQPPPQLNEAATESDLYIYVMRSYRMFEQAVYGAAYRQSAIPADVLSGEGGLHDEGARGNRQLFCASSEVVDTMQGRIRASQYQQLEDAVDRPSIRFGIGGLMINGSIMFEKAAKGDRPGVLKRIARCIDVFKRFPGLCRIGGMGSHIAHILITALAAMEGPEAKHLYIALRAIYNTNLPSGSALVPPLEAWQGVSSCCDYFYCRSVEGVILSKGMAFSIKPDSPAEYPELSEEKGIRPLDLDMQNSSGCLSATNITAASASASASASAPCLPQYTRARFDISSKCAVNPRWHGTRSAAPVAPILNSNISVQAMLQANVENETGLFDGEKDYAGVMAGPVDTRAMAPEFREWVELVDGAGNEKGITQEDWQIGKDWLEETHALLASVESAQVSSRNVVVFNDAPPDYT